MNGPLSNRCDVLVVGGGVAGVPAAVTAARLGMSTLLVEKEGFPGGAGVLALHRYICGLYLNGPDKPVETLNAGLPREIIAGLRALSPSSHPIRLGRVWGFPFEPRHLQTVYTDLVRHEPDLVFLASTSVKSVRSQAGRVGSVTVQTPGGTVEIAPSAVIDCTGSGTVIQLSGASFELAPEPERQAGGCTVHLEGIEGDCDLLGVKIAWMLSKLRAGDTKGLPLFAGFTAGPHGGEGFCKLSLPGECVPMENMQLDARITRFHTILAEHLPELRHSRVTRHSGLMEREGIRLAGEWELDETAILEARTFSDGVVRNAWPVEFWDSAGVPSYAYPPDGEYYEIPRRCLRSRVLENLFASGRCISASSRALASTRVMGTCMALGEASGTEAAVFAQHHPQ